MTFNIKQKNNNYHKQNSSKFTIFKSNLQKENESVKNFANGQKGIKKKYLSQCLTQTSNSNDIKQVHKQIQKHNQYQMLMNQFLSSYKQQQQQSTILYLDKQIQQFSINKGYRASQSKQQNKYQKMRDIKVKNDQKKIKKQDSPSKNSQNSQKKNNKNKSITESIQSSNKASKYPKTKIQKFNLKKEISKSKDQLKKTGLSYFKNTQKYIYERPHIQIQEFNPVQSRKSNKINSKKKKNKQNSDNKQVLKLKNTSLQKFSKDEQLKKKSKLIHSKQNHKNQIIINIQLDEIILEDSHQFKNKQISKERKSKFLKHQKSTSRSKSKQNKLLKSFNLGTTKRISSTPIKNNEVVKQQQKIIMNSKTTNFQSTNESIKQKKYEFSYNILQNQKYIIPVKQNEDMDMNKNQNNSFRKQDQNKLQQKQFVRQIKNDLEKLIKKINCHSYDQNN